MGSDNRIHEDDRLPASREHLLTTLFDLNPLMTTLARWPECTVVDVNRAFTEKTGWSRHEVLDHTGPDIGLWARSSDRDRWLEGVRTHGGTTELEAELRTRNGVRLDVLFSSQVIEVDGRRYVLTVGTDVTERLHREAEVREKNLALEAANDRLAENEHFLRTLFELTPAMVAVTTWADDVVIDANRAFLALAGRPREELRGTSLPQLGVFADPDVFQGCRHELSRHGRITGKEVVLEGGDGTVRTALLSSVRLEFADGPRVLHALVDITERKRAAEALRESESRYRNLFETVADGIFVAAPSGRFLEVNPAACRQLGYSREELLRRTISDISGPPGFDLRDLLDRLGSGGSLLFETANVHQDGSQVPVELALTLVEQGAGEGAVLGVARDLTERRQAEEARRRLEEQLLQNAKMEAIGRLAGGVAHDFNNLLTAISGFTEMLLAAVRSDDPMHADLEGIMHAAQRASGLTNQLLAFSRRQVIAPMLLDINEHVAGATRMLERLIGEDIRLERHAGTGLGSIRVDPNQLEQILVNLAANARDAMPRGGRLLIETSSIDLDDVYCASHLDAKPGRYVLLSISDNGSGMPTQVLEHLFEPFYTTKEEGRGTGLGMSTVYGIVRQSGGFIHVYSELEVGSTFRIYFPRVDEEPDAPRPSTSQALPRGRETILVVEDEDLVRSLAVRLLKRQGYNVVAFASSGDALLAVAERLRHVDLLLTDVVLPNLSGPQLYGKLHVLRPDLRVVYMSGYTASFIAQHGFLQASTFFLQKPFTLEALARKVREALDAPPPG